jgi:hypothetical protein
MGIEIILHQSDFGCVRIRGCQGLAKKSVYFDNVRLNIYSIFLVLSGAARSWCGVVEGHFPGKPPFDYAETRSAQGWKS